MIETNEDVRLVKEGTILEVINSDKNKIGGWLNRLSQISKENISDQSINLMEWEKAVFILLWNARVKELNSLLKNSVFIKKIAIYHYCNLNNSIEQKNNVVIKQNCLLKEFLQECSKAESLDLAFIYRKLIADERIKKEPAPNIQAFVPLFEIISDFVF